MSWAEKFCEGEAYANAYAKIEKATQFAELPEKKFSGVGVSLAVFPTPYRGLPSELRAQVVDVEGDSVLEGYSWPRLIEKRGELGVFQNDFGRFSIRVPPDATLIVWHFED